MRELIGIVVTAIVGLLTAAATFFAGRKQAQASFLSAIQEAAHFAIKDLKDLCKTLREEVDRVRAELVAVTAIKEEVAAERARCEAELAHYRAEIERLLGEPVAPYLPGLDPPR